MSSPASIWVVEDDTVVAQYVGQLLATQGYNVSMYSGGQAAIDDLESGKSPDLVILDIMMTPPDGNDVLQLIKKLGYPPVVVMTAYEMAISEALRGVPFRVVPKPFGFSQLIDTVEAALRSGVGGKS